MKRTVTIFENLSEVNKPHHINIQVAFDRIKTGNSAKLVEKIRSADDPSERRSLKKQLSCVLFSGAFKERNIAGCVKHSGLIILDFDHIVEFAETKAKLQADEYIYALWDSPSGDGLKALVKIPPVKEDHGAYWKGLKERYPDIDKACKDVSRITFESWDENLYINEDSKEFTNKIEEAERTIVRGNALQALHTDYKTVDLPLKMIRNAQDGEKHYLLRNASILMGGYVSAGRVEENEAERLLMNEISKHNLDDIKTAEQTIRDGLTYGKALPLQDIEQQEKQLELYKTKIYHTLHEVKESIIKKYEDGISRGFHPGYDNLYDFYSVKMGATTYVYGPPYSGKTQLWFQILIKLSELHGMRHAILSPEQGDVDDVYIELIEMVAQADFYNDYHGRMSKEELNKACDFIDKHFIVVDPKDQGLTAIDFLEYVNIIEQEYNVKIHTVTADPFNEFEDQGGGTRDDLYMEKILSAFRKNARAYERHNCIITHVRDQPLITNTDGLRYYPRATPREIARGQTWFRKGMAMLSVWRTPKGLNDADGVPYPNNASLVYIDKAKPKGVGTLGEVMLLWDAKRHAYYENETERNGSFTLGSVEVEDKSFDGELPF